MNHIILFFACILSVEIFYKLNFFDLCNSFLRISKKVGYVIQSKKISDHWKEKIIPKYSLKMMKISIQILTLLILVIIIFVLINISFSGFLKHVFSFSGIIETIIFAFGDTYFKE